MRVVFTNNYPIDEIRRLHRAGLYPGQHLWGIDAVEGRYPVVDVPYSPPRRRQPLGQVQREAATSRLCRRGDICYSAEPRGIRGLMALRRLGLWRHPIVAVVHHEVPPGFAHRGFTHADRIIALSNRVADSLVANYLVRSKDVTVLPWGPDLNFARYQSTGNDFIVSVGKTGRDLATLAAAVESLGARALLPRGDGQRPYVEALEDLRRAAVVAIPLHRTDRLAGLTELNDALALGKPVVMTRNLHIDLDIEKLGFGIWVEPHDTEGWRVALRELLANDSRREEMAVAARGVAEHGWNAAAFGRGVVDVIDSI